MLPKRKVLSWRDLKGILPATGLDPDEAIRRAKGETIERKYGRGKPDSSDVEDMR